MPPEDKKVNTTGAVPVINRSGAYASYIMPNLIGSPFITQYSSDPAAPEKPPTPTSESQDPIVGYRVWSLNSDGLLVSSVKKEVWPARKRMSRGRKEDGLGLGIHAAKSADRIMIPPVYEALEDDWMMFGGLFGSLFGKEAGLWDEYRGQVAGEVSLWGEVKEFKHGYTAEFAYPKRLWVPETLDVMQFMRLEQNYGVPVETRADLGPWKESNISKMNTSMLIALINTPAPPRKPGRAYFSYDAQGNPTIPDGPPHLDPLAVTDSGKFDGKGKP